jgi:methionyl-tRNA formyltransferase
MRLIMMGTGPFAVPTLEALYGSRHAVAALVTSPLRAHRGKPVAPISSIRESAERRGTPILDPENANAGDFSARLAAFNADLLVVCDYGQILAPAVLSAARRGGVNLHASLLPKYRGAAPIQWAIYNGETETGVTVIHITPQLDAGPCVAQLSTPIGPDETAAELEVRLSQLGARLICETIDRLEAGDVQPLPQDPALATRAPRLKKADGAIDWTRPAAAIKNHIRAMEPWPKTYTFWGRADAPPLRLILGPAAMVESLSPLPLAGEGPGVRAAGNVPDADILGPAPGTVLKAAGEELIVAAGQGAVSLMGIQPSGKRMLTIAEFLRGYPLRSGDRFATEGLGCGSVTSRSVNRFT